MKKLPLWAKIVLPTFLIIALVALFFGGTLYDFIQINPLATGEVIPNVYAVRTGTVNSYLVKGDSGYIMIDAGSSKEQVEMALKDLEILPEEIISIFLTHSDSDHTASVSLFQNANLYLPELEVQMIDGTTMRNSRRSNSLDSIFLTLKDNDVIEINRNTIRCIATPGHTPGSMSFLINDEYLFTGDAMGLINGKADLFISIYNMDEEMQAESISKLSTIGTQYIFTAHHGYSDNPIFVFEGWQ